MFKIVNLIPFENKQNYFLDSLNDVSILIKTLERPQQLINQLHSIQKYKFKGPILIADDSKVPYGDKIISLFPDLNITYIDLPFDTGTAEGRNIMLEKTNTPFFVLCDDDFIFEPRTRLPLMRKMLIENNLDLLGGVFRQYNLKSRKERLKFKISNWLLKFNILIPSTGIYEYSANFEIDSKVCRMQRMTYQDPFTRCDMTHNFFIARTDKVRAFGGWNPILKGGEHQNFFIRAKLNDLKIATTRQCGVVHDRWSPMPEFYNELRERGTEFQRLALKEFNIETVEGLDKVFGERFGGKKNH
jgi:glycosyltransferase involved in cell wall biosynthesis